MKKILSLILALSLIISVAPMSFATGAEESTDEPGMYFNFNAAAYGEESDISYDTLKQFDNDGTYAEKNTDPWYITGDYCYITTGTSQCPSLCNVTSKTQSEEYPGSRPNSLYWETNYADPTSDYYRSVLVIRLKCNETGYFKPTLDFTKMTSSLIYSFYFAPLSAGAHPTKPDVVYEKYVSLTGVRQDKMAAATYEPLVSVFDGTPNDKLQNLGTVDFSAASPTEAQASLSNVYIPEAGEYYLYICGEKKSASSVKDGRWFFNLHSLTLTPVFTASVDETYTGAPENASVKCLAYYGVDEEGNPVTKPLATAAVPYGESTNISAVDKTYEDEAGDTYNFLYWAKGLDNGVGNKHIISTSNEEFSYKPHAGNNYLIAVYEKVGAAKATAFYDRNGQLLNPEVTDDKLPALPAMAGLGDAIGWEQLGTGVVFDEGVDFSTIVGDKVFMAKYGEPTKNIKINNTDYTYGETVACKAIVDNFDESTFSYWTRTIGEGEPEIMSINPDYSFSAYTNCTIAAVCNGKVELDNPRKIALSTFSVGNNLTAVMAEFIGFGDAKEKGIMFGGRKIAMTTNKAQFTVTNDTADPVTVTGYAIVEENEKTVQYTDGSISVAGETTAE